MAVSITVFVDHLYSFKHYDHCPISQIKPLYFSPLDHLGISFVRYQFKIRRLKCEHKNINKHQEQKILFIHTYIHTSIGIEYNYVLILEANLDRCLNFNFKGHLDTKSIESSNCLLSLA